MDNNAPPQVGSLGWGVIGQQQEPHVPTCGIDPTTTQRLELWAALRGTEVG